MRSILIFPKPALYFSLQQAVQRRRRWPACSFQMARYHSVPKLTGKASARERTSASMPSLRIPAPALWFPKQPFMPNTSTRPTVGPKSSSRSFPQFGGTMLFQACVMPGKGSPSESPRSSHPSSAVISSVWSMPSWWGFLIFLMLAFSAVRRDSRVRLRASHIICDQYWCCLLRGQNQVG